MSHFYGIHGGRMMANQTSCWLVTRQLRVAGIPELNSNGEEPILISHVQPRPSFYSDGFHDRQQTLIDVQSSYSAHHIHPSSSSLSLGPCWTELWLAEALTLINFLWAHFEEQRTGSLPVLLKSLLLLLFQGCRWRMRVDLMHS